MRAPRPYSLRSTLAPLLARWRSLRCSLPRTSEQQVEDGHAHGDPVADLFDDRGADGVGHLCGDLHAAIHRARVHDDRVVVQERHPAGVEAVAAAVLAGTG